MIIANKCEMTTPFRVVTESEGNELANSLGIEYMETSAKNSINVTAVFDKMATSILNQVNVNPTLVLHSKALPQGKKVKAKRCC